MMLMPVAEWLPDQPDYANPGSSYVHNVLPRTAQSYGPIPSLTPFSSALIGRCVGAFGFLDSANNANNFAGDLNHLYWLTTGTSNWSDVSVAGGYNTAAEGRWSPALFGSRVLMSNYADPIQSFRVGADTRFSALSAAAPKARYLAVVRDWLVAANTYDGANGAIPYRVWWSAINDPTNWPTPGTTAATSAQSDYQDLVGTGGWVQGIIGNLGSADGVVFLERAIYRMSYVGPPAIFSFSLVEGARGTPAPGSIVQLGALAFYLGEDGFYQFDGANSKPIGANRIDKTFFADLDQSYFNRISSAVDPINKIVFWAYPGAGNASGNPNRLLAYNWSIVNSDGSVGRWSLCDISCELIFRSLSQGYSLETLSSAGYTSLESVPFSLDSRVWTGGRLLLSAFDATHRLNYFSGACLASTVETSEAQLFPGRRGMIRSARPMVDGDQPAVSIGIRNRLTDPVSFLSPVTVNSLGECPQRANARYHRARIILPAGASFQHIQGVDVTASPGEQR
jgi:hypothetical protein